MNSDLKSELYARARDRCEYCRAPLLAYATPFQIEHVIARQHGGKTESGNLALAWGPNIASCELVRLFHPRTDDWKQHFAWNGAVIVGITAVGRATVNVLEMNDSLAVAVRESLMMEGVDFNDVAAR